MHRTASAGVTTICLYLYAQLIIPFSVLPSDIHSGQSQLLCQIEGRFTLKKRPNSYRLTGKLSPLRRQKCGHITREKGGNKNGEPAPNSGLALLFEMFY